MNVLTVVPTFVFRTITRLIFPVVCVCAWVLPTQAAIIVMPPGSTVEGKTIGEWSANWWQYAFSFSAPNDPFTDETGVNQNLNQSAPVHYENQPSSGNIVHRNFEVPAGMYQLVSIIAAEVSEAEVGFGTPVAQLRQMAAANADLIDPSSLFLSIDGVAVPNIAAHREISPVFQFVGAPNNAFVPFGGPVGNSGNAVSEGYFVMIPPLPLGTHEIHFGGIFDGGVFVVDNTDTITITAVPEPSTLILAAVGLVGLLSGAAWNKRRAHVSS